METRLEQITEEGERMYLRTLDGLVWVSETAPYWKDWRGRQAYRYLIAARRAQAAPADER